MRFGRKRRYFGSRLLGVVLVLAILAVLLIACRGKVCDLLGISASDYESETVTGEVGTTGEIARRLVSVVSMLTEDSAQLTPFSGSREAVRLYSDALLGDMLCDNYGRYTGNAEAIAAAASAYPGLNVTTLIDAEEFDRLVYRYFGGASSVPHQSGTTFTYLDKIGAFTTVAQPTEGSVDVRALSIAETANTYRLRLSCSDLSGLEQQYLAVFVKREDGTCYLHSLANA